MLNVGKKVKRRCNGSVAAKGRQGHRLSGDDIEYLRKNTRYDEKEIKEWYKGFKARTNIILNWLNVIAMNHDFKCCLLDGVQKGEVIKVCPECSYHKMACSMVYSKSLLRNVHKTWSIVLSQNCTSEIFQTHTISDQIHNMLNLEDWMQDPLSFVHTSHNTFLQELCSHGAKQARKVRLHMLSL